jgi:hypothetical protein
MKATAQALSCARRRPALCASAALLLAAALALAAGAHQLSRTALTSVDSLRVAMDAASTLRVSATGLAFSAPSFLPLTLCHCALTLPGHAPLPAPFDGGAPCASLSAAQPSIAGLGLALAPSARTAQALLQAGSAAALTCALSTLGVPLPGLALPLRLPPAAAPGAAASAGSAAAAAAAASDDGAFELTWDGSWDPAALLSLPGLALRELVIDLPGLALGLLPAAAPGAPAALAALAVFPFAARLTRDAPAADAAAAAAQRLSWRAYASPRAALAAAAPQALAQALAQHLGLSLDLCSALLSALKLQGEGAAADAAWELRAQALGLGARAAAADAAWPARLQQWHGLAEAAAAGGAASGIEAAPLPWLRALLLPPTAPSAPLPPASADALLLHVTLGDGSSGGAQGVGAFPTTLAPRLALAFTSSNANIDLAVPTFGLSAALSLTSPSFLSRALFVLLSPLVQNYPAPVTVATLVPTNWFTATPDPAVPGNFLVGPPRTSPVLASVTCGSAGVAMALDAGSGLLSASAAFTLPNARGCLDALLREYRLGVFAGLPAEGFLLRNPATALPGRPRGSIVVTLPSLGVVSLPLAISTRTWLVGVAGAASVAGQVLLSAPPPAASLLPAVLALTAPDPSTSGPGAQGMLYGLATHAPEVVGALDALVTLGCAASAPAPSAALCGGFEAQWRAARYVGVEGLLLNGICAGAAVNSDALCVPVTFASDVFGVALFGWNGQRAPGSADLVAGNAALDPWLTPQPAVQFRSGRAPSRISFQDAAGSISYRATVLASWEVIGSPTGPQLYTGINITGALLYAMLNVSVAGRPGSEAAGGGGIPASLAAFRLPRVPASTCSLPIVPTVRGALAQARLLFATHRPEAHTPSSRPTPLLTQPSRSPALAWRPRRSLPLTCCPARPARALLARRCWTWPWTPTFRAA